MRRDPGIRAAPAGPQFSVVIPTRNRPRLAQRAVADVLAQELSALEVIVVIDGPDDATREVLGGTGDPRVRVIEQDHGGPCVARNRGAADARAPWLVFLDDDDAVDAAWLRSFAAAITRAEGRVGVVSSGAEVIDDAGRRVRTVMPAPLGPGYADAVAQFLPGAFAIDRDLFQRIGGYDPAMTFGENFELGMRAVWECRRVGLGVVVGDGTALRWTEHPVNTRRAAHPELLLTGAERMLERHPTELALDRRLRATTRSIAGVNAMKLGRFGMARRHLWSALGARPGDLRVWARLAAALVPPIGRRLYPRVAAPG